MRIALDATAVPSKPMGAGWYIIYLVRALSRLETSHQLVVFAQEHLRPFLAGCQGGQTEMIWLPDQPPALRLIWEQAIFPRLLRRLQIDLLHSPHYTMPLAHPLPTVVTFHDLTFFLHPEKHTRAKRFFFPWMMRRSAQRADWLIADSESTRQDAISFVGADPARITTVHLGYQDIFRPIADSQHLDRIRQEYRLPPRYILYVGALEPRKNVPLLLRAFEQLAVRLPHHLVLTGGTGWKDAPVLAQMEAMRFSERVHRLGHVPHEHLPAIFNLAEVFVYPSAYEGFGLPPLEAMACGTPVITSNISSMPEFVGQAGVLIPPNDESALSNALQSVLTDEALRQRLKTAGPQRAASFTWERTAQKTLAIYEQVLAGQ